MSHSDIRWRQRFASFKAAFTQLTLGVNEALARPLNNLEKQGLIQSFEFTHELAWNVLKDYIQFQGAAQITGSRDAVREAFQRGLITDGEIWMEMITSRNQTTHTYNQKTADTIIEKIIKDYFLQFQKFASRFTNLENTTLHK